MPILAKLQEFLEANNAAYSVHAHPTAFTAQEVAALSHVKGRALAKVVIVKAGADLAMLVLPADHRVDLNRVKTVLGAMPPFGNLFGLPVYADRSLEKDEEIVFNAGTHTLTAKMALRDFVRLVKPRMEEFAVHM